MAIDLKMPLFKSGMAFKSRCRAYEPVVTRCDTLSYLLVGNDTHIQDLKYVNFVVLVSS